MACMHRSEAQTHSTVHGWDCLGHRGCTTRVPSARVCGHHLRPAGTAQRTRDVYYPSHALPRQTNHQQRKPTRPPTTTTAATEIPAIAPVERPLLFALEDVQLNPSALGAYPATHSVHILASFVHALHSSTVNFSQLPPFFLYPSVQTSQILSALHVAQFVTVHVTHFVPSVLGFLSLLQVRHLSVASVFEHSWQSATPPSFPEVLPQETHLFPAPVSALGKAAPVHAVESTHAPSLRYLV